MLAPAGGAARILHVAAHTPGEAVSSPARVLGSGDLKFKYLNPNSLLVAVGVPAAAAGGSGDAAEERLTVMVLDAVTGRVLFSQKHEVRVVAGVYGEGGQGRAGERRLFLGQGSCGQIALADYLAVAHVSLALPAPHLPPLTASTRAGRHGPGARCSV